MYQLGAGEYNTVQTGRTGHIYLIHFILWSFMFSVTCKNYHNLNGQHINILVGSQRSVRLYSGVVKAKNIFYFQYKQRVKNAGTLSTCKASAKYKLYLRDSYVVVVVGSSQCCVVSDVHPLTHPARCWRPHYDEVLTDLGHAAHYCLAVTSQASYSAASLGLTTNCCSGRAKYWQKTSFWNNTI